MKDRHKNIAQSVRDRLRTLANRKHLSYNHVLIRYVLERLLYRLSESPQQNNFALKGGMLLAIWMTDPFRMTMDIDLLGYGNSRADELQEAFRNIMDTPVANDGVVFDINSVNIKPIREQQDYRGFRIKASAFIGSERIPVQIDIGFGDAVTPSPEEHKYPTLLDTPAPHLKTYPRETVVAEKLEAIVIFGIGNSRMKDYYDLFFLSRHFPFDGQTLSQAIQATFERRRTELPNVVPPALSQNFGMSTDAMEQWKVFLQKTHLLIAAAPPDLANVVKEIEKFVMPPTIAATSGEIFACQWKPSKGWTAGISSEHT
ncbi:MAG: nucleotidyl transferase AbiEii/AbiGii toxin family protein [Hyphomicrobiales bacterium]|nr:nucleotidyl transferase AbiEii/AbiGii toxin family protein [Hyphomicrobiales bacterium]